MFSLVIYTGYEDMTIKKTFHCKIYESILLCYMLSVFGEINVLNFNYQNYTSLLLFKLSTSNAITSTHTIFEKLIWLEMHLKAH